MIDQTVRFFLQKYNLARLENNLLVAFSGGVDSLCLLFTLFQLKEEFKLNLMAIHINHHWRSPDSNEDEEVVQQYCNELKIPLFIRHLDKNLPKTEAIAREHRYKAFNEVAKEQNIKALLTAHTKSDQLETLLYRIIKGTGHKGLCGIPEIRKQINGPTIYRPLLNITRQDIEAYNKNHNLLALIDNSNFDQKYLRNRIRHSLIPELKTYNNQVEESILKLSKISSQNESIIQYYLKDTFNNIFEDTDCIKTKIYKELPDFIKPRILIKLLSDNCIDYDFAFIEELLQNIESTDLTNTGKKFSLNKKLFLHITQKNIKIISSIQPCVIKSSATVVIPGITELKDLNIMLKTVEYDDNNPDNISFPPADSNRAMVDLSEIKTDICLRTRRPGDIINPIGMEGHMKLKKYLINKHIAQDIKDSIPVIARGNEVLWLAGICLSNKIKVTTRPTHVFEILRG